MKRGMILFLLGTVTLVPWAHGSEARDLMRIRDLEASKSLLDLLVINGMRLADEEDPLTRADYCTDVAEKLATEIKRCWEGNQSRKGIELTRFQSDLLRTGVAGNLVLARRAIPVGSADETKWKAVSERIKDRVDKMSPMIKEQIDSSLAQQAEMKRVMTTVDVARDEVFKAIKMEPEKKTHTIPIQPPEK